MYKKYFLPLLLLLAQHAFAQKEIKLEEIWLNGTFAVASNKGFNFLQDGIHYSKLENTDGLQRINSYNILTGKPDAEILQIKNAGISGKVEDYLFSPDEKKILLSTDVEHIYRHSTRSKFYIWDTKNRKTTELYNKPQQYATFNNTGDKVAFVCENNLFFKDLVNGRVTAITSDGKINEIINGATDWVYEEEFAISQAFCWSPDGKKIAYLRFDEREVPEFRLDFFNNDLYPAPYTYRYPKVGQPNSTVAVFIYDTQSGQNLKVSRDEGPDDYYPRILWTQDAGKLCMMHMNRLQNELTLFIADAATGDVYPLLRTQNKWYIEVPEILVFLKDKQHFIMNSSQDGFNNIYLHNMSGRPVSNITSCPCDITDFYGIDEENGTLFYQAAAKNPMEREIYSADLKGINKKLLSSQNGSNAAEFSSTLDYFVLENSSFNRAPTYVVYNRKGEKIRDLESNPKIAKLQKEKDVSEAAFFNFKTPDHTSLNGWMIQPKKMKKKKKYPVLMYVYGGPGSQQVLDRWKGSDYWWFQMLAQKGYIVACVDNRGTGARGEEFQKMTYKQLGKYETGDQIEAAKYLGSLPQVDPSRIGIFGWSYGGFMAASCLFKGEGVFKSAISVAPVTNWKWYDNIYTERYMQTDRENDSGYEENSPVNFADRMKGNLLLVHGTADDNVHFQHSVELCKALIKANKQYDTYFYPNQNHSIRGGNARLHLYTKMTSFLLEKL